MSPNVFGVYQERVDLDHILYKMAEGANPKHSAQQDYHS